MLYRYNRFTQSWRKSKPNMDSTTEYLAALAVWEILMAYMVTVELYEMDGMMSSGTPHFLGATMAPMLKYEVLGH